ncbi:MAG: hypothetical protein ACK4WM_07965 [Thermoflexales bacterium]
MPKKKIGLIIGSVWFLVACSSGTPKAFNLTSYPDRLATSTPTPPPASSVPTAPIHTPEAANWTSYEDRWLCFSVQLPAGWKVDGVPGGFARFAPPSGQGSLNITNVALPDATLAQALADVRRGPLGASIHEVRDFTVGNQPALWVTFAPGAEFKFVVLVIAPDCRDGPHPLFISATDADQKSFKTFLNAIRFLQESP